MKSPWIGLSAGSLLAFLAILVWLGRLENGGVPHADLVLADGSPATLYLPPRPGDTGADWRLPAPAPPGERPPIAIVVHGIASDRANMSVLARSLAVAGYAAIAVDLRGHGGNRNSFTPRGNVDVFDRELGAAVDFAHASPHVDGSRIALIGHSMGAGAALEFGTREQGLDAVVLISGGFGVRGPHRPPNVLLVHGGSEPDTVSKGSSALARDLAGETLAPGRTRGRFESGTAVGYSVVAGANHQTVVASDVAIGEITAWLDRVFTVERAEPAGRRDPRLAAAGLGFLALLLGLPAVGALVGRLAPRASQPASQGAWVLGAGLAAALLLAMPLFSSGRAGSLLSIEVADVVVPHLGFAGGALWIGLVLSGRETLRSRGERFGPSLFAAAIGFALLYHAMVPLGVAFHALTLTPERALIAVAMAALLSPFTLAMHFALRRGGTLAACLRSVVGRLSLIAILALGVRVGVLPSVVLLMLPSFALLFVLVEITSTAIYAVSRNVVAAALLEAMWLAWIFGAVLPVRV